MFLAPITSPPLPRPPPPSPLSQGVLLMLNLHATESEYNTESKSAAQATSSVALAATSRYSRAVVRERAERLETLKLRPELNELQWKRHRLRRE